MASGFSTSAVAVGTTATLLVAANGARGTLWIHNQSAADLFIGGAAVTTTDGLCVPKAEKIVFYRTEGDMAACEAIYGVAASAQSSPADTRVGESLAK